METRQGHGLKNCYGPGVCEQDCNVQKPGHYSSILYSTSIAALLDPLRRFSMLVFLSNMEVQNLDQLSR